MEQDFGVYNVSKLAEEFEVSKRELNELLVVLGLQEGYANHYHLTPEGRKHLYGDMYFKSNGENINKQFRSSIKDVIREGLTEENLKKARELIANRYDVLNAERDRNGGKTDQAIAREQEMLLRQQNHERILRQMKEKYEKENYTPEPLPPLIDINSKSVKIGLYTLAGAGAAAFVLHRVFHKKRFRVADKKWSKNLPKRLAHMELSKEDIELVLSCLETEEDRNGLLQYMDEENPTARQCIDYALAKMKNYEAEEGEVPEYAFKNPPVLKSQLMKDRLADVLNKRGVSDYYRALISNCLKSDSHVTKFIEAVENSGELREYDLFHIALVSSRDDNRRGHESSHTEPKQ